MATRANKITIRVTPARHTQTITLRASGRAGQVSLSIPPLYDQGAALSPGTSAQAYWNAVLIAAQAMVLSS
jgi:hypothetical protein